MEKIETLKEHDDDKALEIDLSILFDEGFDKLCSSKLSSSNELFDEEFDEFSK